MIFFKTIYWQFDINMHVNYFELVAERLLTISFLFKVVFFFFYGHLFWFFRIAM